MNFDWQAFLCAAGLALVFESLPWLLAPDRVKQALARLLESGDEELRRWGSVLLGAGVVLIWLARG